MSHVHVIAAGQDVDDLVVLNVGDGSCVAGVVCCELDEPRLVEPIVLVRLRRFLSASANALP